jgi:protoporphyrinogen oxidase
VLRSFTMPSGLSEIPAVIAAKAGMKTESGRTATAVAAHSDGFVVRLDDGAERTCRYLTLAVPPDVAARLLTDVVPDAASIVDRIGVAEIDTLLLAFDKADLSVAEMAGLISVDGPFLSAVSRDFLADARYRGFAFHFPGGILNEADRISAACAALDVNPDKAVATAHLSNRLPSLRKGHQELIAALDRTLAGLPMAITGNWFLGVSIEDCVTRSRGEHERLFAAARSSA